MEFTAAATNQFPIANELRAAPRQKAALLILVTNLTQAVHPTETLLLDVSATGMRLQTALPLAVGDAVRVDLPRFTVLAEVIHRSNIGEEAEVGLKLVHSLDREQLDNCLAVWNEHARFATCGA
jgi:PilZ domain